MIKWKATTTFFSKTSRGGRPSTTLCETSTSGSTEINNALKNSGRNKKQSGAASRISKTRGILMIWLKSRGVSIWRRGMLSSWMLWSSKKGWQRDINGSSRRLERLWRTKWKEASGFARKILRWRSLFRVILGLPRGPLDPRKVGVPKIHKSPPKEIRWCSKYKCQNSDVNMIVIQFYLNL